ncbi:hypothetical protein LPC08_08390 [Roseomonas sp. OT10]|uniref:hypothetical protein n=1 Tax=Roseomonas cutis TaxID=2897332 RepID=UPI001E62F58A|nr:hypothetical protein [Roseomonas sp. OT10]UFN50619.1 hypothetical protein LPC08_08390 [Roseomonas sp. OT10]
MKINAKDVISGGLLIALAAIGLWLNLDHTLGSARRMGPGYMPMLVFWLLLALGAVVVIIGLKSGPDPLQRWTRMEVLTALLGTATGLIVWQVLERMGIGTASWSQIGFAFLAGLLVLAIAPGWRPLALVHAGLALFGLSLEPLGLIIALTLCIVVAALSDETHTPLGVVGMVIFLCVLCWFVFIYELDIRVPLWPTIF